MFGLLHLFGVGLIKIGLSIRNDIININSKNNAIEKNEITYLDNKGGKRLVSTNEYVYFTKDKSGHNVLQTINGRTIKDYDKEKREKWIIQENEKYINTNIKCIGFFEDLYPDRSKRDNWYNYRHCQYVYVYQCNKRKYLKLHKHYYDLELNKSVQAYVDIFTGELCFLEEVSKDMQKYIERINKNNIESNLKFYNCKDGIMLPTRQEVE